jgi:Leishmanolysin
MHRYSTGSSKDFTTISVALFDDSGWYGVDYSQAKGSRKGTTFGYKQGCGFARDSKCIINVQGKLTGIGKPPHYFPASQRDVQHQCRLDRLGFGWTEIYSYPTYPTPLPPQYQYYPGRPDIGGGLPAADYCPVMIVEDRIPGNPRGMCSAPISYSTMTDDDKNRA